MRMKKNNQYEGIELNLLRRYLKTRTVIDEKADEIANVSRMLTLLKYCGDDTVSVSPHALAYFFEMINYDICKIIESLDNFIYILDAESVVKKADK